MSDDKESAERAKELLVYGPLGLALFLRDNAPQFMRMFVARGRNELEQRGRSVGEQLDQVRSLGESVAADGGPEMLRLLSTGISALREQAEHALDALGVTSTSEVGAPTGVAGGAGGAPQTPLVPDAPPPTVAWESSADLAIPAYDDLSASQIVEHLEGLPPAELEAIREYEAGHRGRATILGKIAQLTRDT